MSFLKDPLHEPELRGRHPTGTNEDPPQPATNEPREPRLYRTGEPPDAEMLDVIQTFETLYAEVTLPPETRSDGRAADDLVIEFPADSPAARGVKAPAQPAALAEADEAGKVTAPASLPLPDRAPADIRDWSARRRTAWPRLLLAAGIALALGTGIGYMAGKIPGSSVSATKIAPSPEGGARLRFDYDMKKR